VAWAPALRVALSYSGERSEHVFPPAKYLPASLNASSKQAMSHMTMRSSKSVACSKLRCKTLKMRIYLGGARHALQTGARLIALRYLTPQNARDCAYTEEARRHRAFDALAHALRTAQSLWGACNKKQARALYVVKVEAD